MSDLLRCVEVSTGETPESSIIWLHGLGANGHDFEGIVPELRLAPAPALRFVFPHAPVRAITINNGYAMPAWFDILALGEERAINSAQLLLSAAEVHKLIDREIERGIAADRIMLAGFSQGGAVSYHAALTYDKPLAGLMALSSWFPTAEAIEIHPANAGLPVQVYHGTQDPVLPLAMGENSVRSLERLGFAPHFHTYPMAHSVCAQQIGDMAEFITEILGQGR